MMKKKQIKTTCQKLTPPPKLTVSTWADLYSKLSSESSAEPGSWNTARAPYQQEIMDAVNDKSLETVVVMSSAQVGKTEIINNIVGYFIHQDPAPMLVVQPTEKMAESWSTDRLSPMLRDSEVFKDLIKDPRSRDAGNKVLYKRFPGGHITMAGSNSPSSLASRPTTSNQMKVKLFSIGTDTAKELIYSRLKITEPGPGYCHFPSFYDEAYFKQLTAEKVVTRYNKGFPLRKWEKPQGRRNEALDCRVYALAALHILNPNLEQLAAKMLETIERKEEEIKEQRKAESFPINPYLAFRRNNKTGFVRNW